VTHSLFRVERQGARILLDLCPPRQVRNSAARRRRCAEEPVSPTAEPSFTARSGISPRRTYEWQVSGDELGSLHGSARPAAESPRSRRRKCGAAGGEGYGSIVRSMPPARACSTSASIAAINRGKGRPARGPLLRRGSVRTRERLSGPFTTGSSRWFAAVFIRSLPQLPGPCQELRHRTWQG
jgi:hypothetical protein